MGVFGSSSTATDLAACGSLIARTFYHMQRGVGAVAGADRALHLRRAMLRAVKYPLLASVALAVISTPALAQQPLPPLPGPGAAAPASPAAAPAGPAAVPAAPPVAPMTGLTPQQIYEHVRRGLVVLEKNGMPVAIGTVLGSDGRILTALSGLAGGDGADVLYADGTTVHAKLGNSDRANDLALLVPAAIKWTEGLPASETDPTGQSLRAMLPRGGAKLGPAEAGVKGKAEAHSKEGLPLLQMLDVDVKGPLIAGAPLLDASGNVAAVLVRACKGAVAQAQAETPFAAWGGMPQVPAKAAACSPVVVGAPVSMIRSFLTRPPAVPSLAGGAPSLAGAAAAAPAPFLGIRGEPETTGSVQGVKVLAVAPQSPADKAGLKPAADVIVAVDGLSIDTPEKLAAAIGKHAPGETVKLLVFGQGAAGSGPGTFREVPVVLRAAP